MAEAATPARRAVARARPARRRLTTATDIRPTTDHDAMARPVPQPLPAPSTLYVSDNAHPRRTVPGWQPAALAVTATGAALVASSANLRSPQLSTRLVCAAGTAIFLVTATATVLRSAAWLRGYTVARIGPTHASALRILAVVAGAITTVLLTLSLLAVPVGQVVLGGALTGALLGIAGQQTLANLIAGVVLLITRTVTVGDRIRLHSGTLGGPFEGTVSEIGLSHVHLHTADAPLAIPNTHVLGGAIAVLDPQAADPIPQRRRRSTRRARRYPPRRHPAEVHTTRVLSAVHPTPSSAHRTTTPRPTRNSP
jgi:hypothetical protein